MFGEDDGVAFTGRVSIEHYGGSWKTVRLWKEEERMPILYASRRKQTIAEIETIKAIQ